MKTEQEIKHDTILECATEIERHWNASYTMVNQKEQAFRSAETLRRMAEKILSSPPQEEPAEPQPETKELQAKELLPCLRTMYCFMQCLLDEGKVVDDYGTFKEYARVIKNWLEELEGRG